MTTSPDLSIYHSDEWEHQAHCAGQAKLNFTDIEPGESFSFVPTRISDLAQIFCHDCPVRERCLQEAQERRRTGLWGGHWIFYRKGEFTYSALRSVNLLEGP
jgi:hypothetical protein